jgi:two-component system response regulator FlrC
MQLIVLGQINSEVTKAIEIAKRKTAKVIFCESIDECLNIILAGKSADLLLVDVSFDIKAISDALNSQKISTNIIAYGLNASPKEAVGAIKSGAKEFLPLPPDEELIAAILETISSDQKPLIYKSESMNKLMDIAEKIAKSHAHILITGESGTGKEVLAHFIHNHSLRKDNSFVRVNCAAIPENLIESELFGHEKGAFTGANNRRIGKFEESSGGTLLLDEVTEMDFKLQAKLLRAIQEKEIDRLGATGSVKVDLRIIATSNRDIQHEVSKGAFREDLYFRLNVINLELPPLRDRKEDISELARFFVKKYCKSNNIEEKEISSSAIEKLRSYEWYGNIRELENSIHRAVLLSGDIIEEGDFSLNKRENILKNNDEKIMIKNALNYCLGDMNQAANILGISIANLTKKLNSNI